MTIRIGEYKFEGPYWDTRDIHAWCSGVYVILGKDGDTSWEVLDIADCKYLREFIETNNRRYRWPRFGHSELAVAVLYMPQGIREKITKELRAVYDPPCEELLNKTWGEHLVKSTGMRNWK